MRKVVDQSFIDLIIENSEIVEADRQSAIPLTERYSIVSIPIEKINKCSLGVYEYLSFTRCYVLESIISLEKSGITRIQDNPNLNLRGQGVLIGIIDTGVDYQHEAFRNVDNTSKIISIWDQNIDKDGPLGEFTYFGTVFNKDTINLALSSPEPLSIVPSTDLIGHGTMLAGIIAGNENKENAFRGIVPNAELIVVKLKPAKKIIRDFYSVPQDAICYQGTDIILGINYVMKVANQLRRPLAICLTLGTNQSDHDIRGLYRNFLSNIVMNIGNFITISAGNEGNARKHYYGIVDAPNYSNEFELKVGANESGFSLEIWQGAPSRLSIELTSPAGENISPIYPSISDCRIVSFIFERTNLYVNNIISESDTGEQLILLRFEYPTEGIWKLKVTNIDKIKSEFHAWLPAGRLISENTYFLNSDPNVTLTSPGTAYNPMTITAYNTSNDSIWINSSRGYTRYGVIKPDLAAPGVEITCPTINNSYGSATGTGAAAAHATGIAAMLLEWSIVKGNNTTLSGIELKKMLIRGAKRDSQQTYPNNVWGYGIIDIFGTFEKIR